MHVFLEFIKLTPQQVENLDKSPRHSASRCRERWCTARCGIGRWTRAPHAPRKGGFPNLLCHRESQTELLGFRKMREICGFQRLHAGKFVAFNNGPCCTSWLTWMLMKMCQDSPLRTLSKWWMDKGSKFLCRPHAECHPGSSLGLKVGEINAPKVNWKRKVWGLVQCNLLPWSRVLGCK